MATEAGLELLNPRVPTHVSGTTVDVVLAASNVPMQVRVLDMFVAASDHKMVFGSLPHNLTLRYDAVVGRVSWASTEEWDAALHTVAPLLDLLADAIGPLQCDPVLAPPMLGGTSSKKVRRGILDCAAWCRDVVMVVAGHAAGAVKAMSQEQMVQALVEDLFTRAQNSFPQNESDAVAMNREICEVRRTGATPEGTPSTSTNNGPYTAEEITNAISRLRESGALAQLPSLSDRIAVVESAGRHGLVMLQYIDDGVAACPSVGATRAILDQSISSATVKYAARHKAAFNFGPGKAECLAVHGSPMFDSTGMGFDLVLTHKMLGITLDAELSFAPHAKATMAMGRSLFDELYEAAEAGGFPVRVLAAQVLIRIVPAVLAGAAVLAAVPNIESDLNSLQAYWARATLGYRRGPRLNWALSRLQCQWDLRLGTLMILQVVMARARLWVLPEGHPATAMRDAARQSPAPSWWRAAGQLMASMPNGPIRDISAHEGFTEEVVAARSSPASRRSLLRRYRQEVALPALRAYDQPSVDAAADRPLPCLGLPFRSLMPAMQRGTQQYMFEDHGGNLYFRLWAVCRVTGRWPLPVLGGEDAPLVLPRCGACPSTEVDVSHALLACGHTSASRRQLWTSIDGGAPTTQQAALLALLGPVATADCIKYV
ncbi:unnamed protein product, partial [Prorocentrum cordatum]